MFILGRGKGRSQIVVMPALTFRQWGLCARRCWPKNFKSW